MCGENLYAEHSLAYDALPSYFMLFSVWTEEHRCLGWDDTCEWAALLGLETVPELWRGEWDIERIRGIEVNTDTSEGYVVRTVAGFAYDDFATHVAKWVRAGHVTTDKHWMAREVVPNGLATSE